MTERLHGTDRTDDPLLSLDEALTSIRLTRGLSQLELADLMDANQSWLCGVETGRVPDPRFSTIIRLTQVLAVTASLTIYDPRTGDSWILPLADRRTAV